MKTSYLSFAIAACLIATAFAGDYIVTLADGTDREAHLAWVNTVLGDSGSVTQVYNGTIGFSGYAVSTTNPAFVQQMNLNPAVVEVMEDAMVEMDAPEFWGLDRSNQVDLPLDNDLDFCGLDGAGVDVCVIDTGIFVEHPDFGGRATWGVNLVGDGIDTDCNGHGTHVAGTVMATNHGMAPAANAIAVKVFGCSGGAPYSRVIAAVQWCVAHAAETGRPTVINMSLTGGRYEPMNVATNAAVAAGVHVAVAAGNSNADACNYSPASASNANTVGSSTYTDVRSSFSNYGPCVDLFAPGSSVTSLGHLGGYTVLSGTSMASPHVAGALAQLLGEDPTMTPAAATALLRAESSKNKLTGMVGDTDNYLLYALGDECERNPGPSCGENEHGTYYCLPDDDSQFLMCVWGTPVPMPVAPGTHCCQAGSFIYLQHAGVPC